MNKNKTTSFNKINQILLHSQNYIAHKNNLDRIKSCIDTSSPSRDQYCKKLLNQHSRYNDVVKNLKISEIVSENSKFTQRIINIHKPISKQKVQRESLQSITSRSFRNLSTAKQRQRTRKNKQILIQNKKMSERIERSISKEDFGRDSYYKQRKQNFKDLNVMGQYSQRSQSVLQNLVYNSLKIKNQDIPFLPMLSTRNKNVNNIKNNKQKNKLCELKQFKSSFHRENISFKKQISFRN